MARYSKFIAAIVGFLTVGGQVIEDGTITTAEWGLLATAAATALAVFGLRNKPA